MPLGGLEDDFDCFCACRAWDRRAKLTSERDVGGEHNADFFGVLSLYGEFTTLSASGAVPGRK